MPPRWMWSVDHELERWFQGVEAERERKAAGNGGGSKDDWIEDEDVARQVRR